MVALCYYMQVKAIIGEGFPWQLISKDVDCESPLEGEKNLVFS